MRLERGGEHTMSDMTRCLFAALVVAGPLVLCGGQPNEDPGELWLRARTFVEQLAEGDFKAAVGTFDETMRGALPEAKLRETWEALIGQVGAFKGQLAYRSERSQGYRIVFVTSEFEAAKIDVRVVFDAGERIAGLQFLPAQVEYDYPPPGYASPDTFREDEVQAGSDGWPLPGNLTIPRGSGPFPAVILVHGSGPNDRDETIGPNKPFRDLAWGLASRGVAVLRYDKRTKIHAERLASSLATSADTFTVQEETVDDAAAAVEYLKGVEEIDVTRIFVLGHSLGGMLVPRIAEARKDVAGFIVLAGSTRPLEDIMVEQLTYLAGLDGEVSDNEKSMLEKTKSDGERIKDPDLDKAGPAEMLLGAPAGYWLDLRGYDPPQEAKRITVPILILQGERDYQVTMTDFQRWTAALGSRDDVTFKSYPSLNHLFMEGKGKSTPAEYQRESHVVLEVVEDIGRWIANP
jgi:dienelactone hydrolase